MPKNWQGAIILLNTKLRLNALVSNQESPEEHRRW
jgi:hypothetical protein